jgi:hypothetical protein
MPPLLKAILLWLAIAFGTLLVGEALTRRYPPKTPFSTWCAACAALTSLPIALLFSPTIIVMGWSGYPAPAALVLLALAIIPEAGEHNWARENLPRAVIGFLGLWSVSWLVTFIRRSQKLERPEQDKRNVSDGKR